MPKVEKYNLNENEINKKNVAIIIKDLAIKLDEIGRNTGFKDEGYDDFYECVDGIPRITNDEGNIITALSIESLYKRLTGEFYNRTATKTKKPEPSATPEEIYIEVNKLIDVANQILEKKAIIRKK